MITLKDWLETVNYRLTEGDSYLWNSFGSDTYSLTSWDGKYDGYSSNVIFDTATQLVYMVEVCDYLNQRAYRYINPDYVDAYKKEIVQRNIQDCAWDSVKWTDLDVVDDWLQKAKAIVNGISYDTRIMVPIELDDDLLMKLFMLAHEQDITLNQLVENILINIIKKQLPDV